jgi:hypothetical protein
MKWKEGGSGNFEQLPTGSHIARCYGVIDLGTQPKVFNGETHLERQVSLSFEFPLVKMEGKYDPKAKGKPMMASRKFKQSLHPKANLRKFLEGWRGRAFKAGEAEQFDPKKLPGLPCRVNVVESQDGTRTFIDSIAPLGKGEKIPKQINPSVYFSLEAEEFDAAVFDKLSNGLKERIAKSPEFIALENGGAAGEEPQGDAPVEGDGEPSGDEPF